MHAQTMVCKGSLQQDLLSAASLIIISRILWSCVRCCTFRRHVNKVSLARVRELFELLKARLTIRDSRHLLRWRSEVHA